MNSPSFRVNGPQRASGMVALSLVSFLSVRAEAQEAPPVTGNPGLSAPITNVVCKVPRGERSIAVFEAPQSIAEGKKTLLLYHDIDPVPQTNALDGSYVFERYDSPEDHGECVRTLHLSLSDPALRAQAARMAWERNKSTYQARGATSTSVKAEVEPFEALKVIAVDLDGHEFASMSLNGRRSNDQISVMLQFDKGLAEAFDRALARGSLLLVVAPESEGGSVSGAYQSSQAIAEWRSLAKTSLSLRNCGATGPITIDDLNSITRNIRTRFPSTTYLFGKNGSMYFRPSFDQPLMELFHQQVVAGDRLQELLRHPHYQAFLATHLEAMKREKLISSWSMKAAEKTTADETSDTTTEQHGTSFGASAEVSVPIKFVQLGFGISGEKSDVHGKAHPDRALKALTERTGLTVQQVENGTEFQPVSARVYTLFDEDQKIDLGASNRVTHLEPTGRRQGEPVVVRFPVQRRD